MIASDLSEVIGNTPTVRLDRFARAVKAEATLYAKVEAFNPGGSVKDRAALFMLDAAERSGALKAGGTVIEPTSGNTGVGLAWLCAVRGYKMILVMPSSMSVERRKLAAFYGAQIELTDARDGMAGAVKRAEQIRAATPNSIIAGQFSNPANPLAHRETTAKEIAADFANVPLDAFVAGVGTGGTVSGVAEGLKAALPTVGIFAVEPKESQVLAGKEAHTHGIQGIGANFVPDNFNRKLVDGILPVTTDDALRCARLLARTEGIAAGISSGAALCGAVALARGAYKNKSILALLPDTAERYLSTPLFAGE